jgi:hypothetical protein
MLQFKFWMGLWSVSTLSSCFIHITCSKFIRLASEQITNNCKNCSKIQKINIISRRFWHTTVKRTFFIRNFATIFVSGSEMDVSQV